MKQALIDYIKRGTNDELYTPNEAIVPIIKYLEDKPELAEQLVAMKAYRTQYGI